MPGNQGTSERNRINFEQGYFVDSNSLLQHMKQQYRESKRLQENVENSECSEAHVFCLVYRTALVLDKSNTFYLFCVYFRTCAKCNFFFVCNGHAVPPAIYSELRFHESFLVSSQQAILETSVDRKSRFEHSPGEHVSLHRPRCTRKQICRFVSSLLGPCIK